MHKLVSTLAVAASLLSGVTSPALAQDFPTGPIRIVVPFAVGTALDVVARATGEGISQELKVPVVIDNRLGASGVVGTDAVAKAPADFTVCSRRQPHYLNTSL
jgi:tripartite-type tricarboxylate transporter receptor subunit TctC